jgi:hypothetical protein
LVSSTHSDIRWVILFFPAFNIPETMKKMYPSENDLPALYSFMWLAVWKKYAADIWNLDVYSEIAKDEKTVLIVHWTADSVAPISYSEQAQSTYKHSTLKTIQWWAHWFSGKQFDESLGYVREFLQSLWVF